MTKIPAALLALAVFAALAQGETPAITIDYPLDGSIFPPEITPPTFLFRDSAAHASRWSIDIAFGGHAPAIHVESKGERLKVGKIDPRCVSPTNELPKLTPQQASAHTWIPDAATWASIKKQSVAEAATVTITGVSENGPVSSGRVKFRTSSDAVGAPIFYRDVPLMPSETEKGVIKPLAQDAVPIDPVERPKHRRTKQPRCSYGHADVRQLPFLFARWQDDGHGHGRAAERQGTLRAGPM